MITNYGYLIKKLEMAENQLEIVKNDLTVKPIINTQYTNKETESFIIYQEGKSNILIPKYYGINNLGIPDKIEINLNDRDKIEEIGGEFY